MYRSLYDTDTTVWSPQGRIFQVEYAMQTVKQGTACVGLKSDNYVVLCAIRRSPSKLAGYQEKLLRVDNHVGLALSGISADARRLATIMRAACMNHLYTYSVPMPLSRLLQHLSEKLQIATQSSTGRPYGVGLLVAGADESGVHLYETCPSGNYTEVYAVSCGVRSHAARSYLEKHFKGFGSCGLEELIEHGIRAIHASLPPEMQLTRDSLSVGRISRGEAWQELSSDAVGAILDRILSTLVPNDPAPEVEPVVVDEGVIETEGDMAPEA